MRLPTLSALFLITVMAMAMDIVGTALAADVGQCDTPDTIKKTLKKEDNQYVIATSSIGLSADKQQLVDFSYTKNSDGSVGYITQTFDPLGEDDSKTRTCIYDRMTNVFAFDVRKLEIPKSAHINVSEEASSTHCKELVKSGQATLGKCNGLNSKLVASSRDNENVLMHGDVVKKQSDGSYKTSGMRITVLAYIPESNDALKYVYTRAKLEGSNVLLYSSIRTGATIVDVVAMYTEYAKGAVDLKIINKLRPQGEKVKHIPPNETSINITNSSDG